MQPALRATLLALFGPDAPGRRCPLIGQEQKFAARCQSDAMDPKPTSLLCAAKWETNFMRHGIAPKDSCSPSENLMLFFGRSLPANN